MRKIDRLKDSKNLIKLLMISNKKNPSHTLSPLPFKLGQNIGYFPEDGKIASNETFPFKAAMSKKWYAILQQLKRAADLTVEDTENEVKEREDEYRSIKEQHKAFSSMMSILKGDPDQMETFTRAMDYMADDISQRLGEMTTVIEETGGVLSQINVDNAVASARADELLKRYETYGIDGLFSSSKKESASSSKFGTSASDAVFSEGPEPEGVKTSSESSSERRYF